MGRERRRSCCGRRRELPPAGAAAPPSKRRPPSTSSSRRPGGNKIARHQGSPRRCRRPRPRRSQGARRRALRKPSRKASPRKKPKRSRRRSKRPAPRSRSSKFPSRKLPGRRPQNFFKIFSLRSRCHGSVSIIPPNHVDSAICTVRKNAYNLRPRTSRGKPFPARAAAFCLFRF